MRGAGDSSEMLVTNRIVTLWNGAPAIDATINRMSQVGVHQNAFPRKPGLTSKRLNSFGVVGLSSDRTRGGLSGHRGGDDFGFDGEDFAERFVVAEDGVVGAGIQEARLRHVRRRE